MIVYQKARIFDPDSPTSGFSVQFNPNTLEYSVGMDIKSQKGVTEQSGQSGALDTQESPLGWKQDARLSVTLFFHSYINDLVYNDVRPTISRIRAFLPVAAKRATTDGSPQEEAKPRISFAWGTMTHTGTLEYFHVTYQMFAFDGTPVQAEVSITIRGEDPDVRASLNNQLAGAAPAADSLQQDDTLYLSSLSWLFQ